MALEQKVLDPDNIVENVRKAFHEVRRELYIRASELQKEGKKIIFIDAGNPHALGQKPLTFPRQVIALCQAPFLMDDPNVDIIFPADAIARAKQYLTYTFGGIGAYSDDGGLPGIRMEIADFILRRDGYSSDPELIFLTNGASEGVMQLLNVIIRNEKDGVLCPIPECSLYLTAIELVGGALVPYYLNEETNWGLDIEDMKQQVIAARKKGISVRAVIVINPGIPIGQCLSEDNLKDLVRFCHKENILMLADEVYQKNVYEDERPFLSAKKVLMDMGAPINKELELVSFHSVSKGYWGECGQRGGYFELTNISPKTVDELHKVAATALSPNVPAQIFVGLMVNPPKPNDASYRQYMEESKSFLESLRRQARMMMDGFNSCRNITCNLTAGAMHSFPKVKLPEAAIEAAKRAGKMPDVFYCLRLVEETGILTVPGSAFGQKDSSFHMRASILASEESMAELLEKFKRFNDGFMAQYGSAMSRL